MKNYYYFLILQIISTSFLGCENSKKPVIFLKIDTLPKKKVGEPCRLKNIPTHAIWGGHLDGGFWFEFVKKYDEIKYRFRIYNDYNGELVLDADFLVYQNKQKLFISNSIDIKKFFFMYKYLEVNDIELRPIYPAYSGTYWEVAKKNGF